MANHGFDGANIRTAFATIANSASGLWNHTQSVFQQCWQETGLSERSTGQGWLVA